MADSINSSLREYIESEIIPRYDSFDKGHQRSHVAAVIDHALYLSSFYPVNLDMVYAAAAYHDTGLCVSRDIHHVESARIVREDKHLPQWFSPEQIDIIADAAVDHRASSSHEPRTIYGRIVAEADRQIVPDTVILRTIQFGLAHYPELSVEGHWTRMLDHLHEKYAEGGYLKLWIPESPNAARLAELRRLINDEVALRKMFDDIFLSLHH